jgi:hypothetical protein
LPVAAAADARVVPETRGDPDSYREWIDDLLDHLLQYRLVESILIEGLLTLVAGARRSPEDYWRALASLESARCDQRRRSAALPLGRSPFSRRVPKDFGDADERA